MITMQSVFLKGQKMALQKTVIARRWVRKMNDNMAQDEINQAEWEDRTNWKGPRWLSSYYSKNDSRKWVPKQIQGMGWTLNGARIEHNPWLITLLALFILFCVGGLIWSFSTGRI